LARCIQQKIAKGIHLLFGTKCWMFLSGKCHCVPENNCIKLYHWYHPKFVPVLTHGCASLRLEDPLVKWPCNSEPDNIYIYILHIHLYIYITYTFIYISINYIIYMSSFGLEDAPPAKDWTFSGKFSCSACSFLGRSNVWVIRTLPAWKLRVQFEPAMVSLQSHAFYKIGGPITPKFNLDKTFYRDGGPSRFQKGRLGNPLEHWWFLRVCHIQSYQCEIIYIWFVVSTPLKNMSSSVGMMTFPISGKSFKIPWFQMFQTTNQIPSGKLT